MRILVFGDSITQGFFDEEQGGWCNRLVSLVNKREHDADYEYNKSVVNLGVSGDTTEDLLKRVKIETESRLLKYPVDDYDVAIVAIGVNDSQFEMDSHENKIPVEQSIENIANITSILKEYVAKLVFVGLAPVVDERIQPMSWKITHGYSNDDIARYNKAIKQFARENECLFIDMDGVYEGKEAECLPDGIHPNAEGHRMIFERVKEVLETEGIL